MSEEPYKNRVWLKGEYLTKKKSWDKIAKELNYTSRTVLNWAQKFGIKSRSKSEAGRLNSNHVDLSKEAIEFLEGLLLGDGCLDSSGWASQFFNPSEFRSYLDWLSGRFNSYCIEQGRITRREGWYPFPDKKLHYYVAFQFCSKRYVELEPFHKKWYRKAKEDEKYKTGRQKKWIKVVPSELKLTPLTCLMWYLGDGSITDRSARLNSNGFTIFEVDFLRNLLGKLGFETTRLGDKSIHILTKSTRDFLDYIGECPIKCYKYRWKTRKYITKR